MEALGLIIDTVGKQIKVLDDKLIAILSELHAWSNSSICTKRQLLSLIGKLSFISQAVRAGRTFLRCLIGLSKKARFLHFKLKINKQARSNIDWWIRCLRPHNGVFMFPKPWVPENTFHIFTDASNVGGAGVLNNDWFCIPFVGDKRWLCEMTIGFRELYCVVVAIKTFASITANARVTLHVENEAVCFCVNNASSKNDYWMELIRELYYVLVHFNMECHAVHLYSQENVVADAIS